jgi:hypothetical protein
MVISREIRPLAAFYPLPLPYKKVLYRAPSGRWGWYALVYGIYASFYFVSVEKIYMGRGV